MQQAVSIQDVVSTNQVAKVPATSMAQSEPVAPVVEPTLERAPVNDPLSLAAKPTPDATQRSPMGVDGEESVDDILAELNAINLEGEDDTSLGDPDKVVELMHGGNALISAGQPDAALAKYNESLKFAEEEGDPEVFFNIGIAYKAKGELAKAAAEYERALGLAPQYAEALNNLGNIRKDQKKYDEAIGHFESSIKIFPDNPNTHNNRGLLNAPEKELSEAVETAMGVIAYEQKRLAAAKVRLNSAKTPEDQSVARSEIRAAEQVGKLAAGKYQRGMSFLQTVRTKLSTAPAP